MTSWIIIDKPSTAIRLPGTGTKIKHHTSPSRLSESELEIPIRTGPMSTSRTRKVKMLRLWIPFAVVLQEISIPTIHTFRTWWAVQLCVSSKTTNLCVVQIVSNRLEPSHQSSFDVSSIQVRASRESNRIRTHIPLLLKHNWFGNTIQDPGEMGIANNNYFLSIPHSQNWRALLTLLSSF